MNYFGFVGWLSFLAWIIADTVSRYILPQMDSVYDALEELSAGGWGTGRAGFFLSFAVQVLLSAAFAYILTTWSAWCVLRCFVYTREVENKALYFVTGFLCCECALGKMAKAGRYRSFFMSVFHFTMAMGAFVVFSMNPKPLQEAYPWLTRLMGVEL
jgi:hypothetical protein